MTTKKKPVEKKPPGAGKDGVIRTTVSLTPKVSEWADELMDELGFDNFSAFIADLIRRKREQTSSADLLKLASELPDPGRGPKR